MPIKTSSAKAKGRKLQQWMARKIAELIGMEYGKDCPVESRPMGQTGVDVRLEKEALKRFPFSVECKAQENWSIPAWIEQARGNTLPGTDWLLVAKKSRNSAIVVMEADTFFRIMEGNQNAQVNKT